MSDACVNVHVIYAPGPPTMAPTAYGQHWVDTLNRQVYESVGTSAVSDWVLIGTNSNKAGILNSIAFSGNPKTASVIFINSLSSPYAVNVTGADTRVWTVESRTSTGFVINSNASLGLTGDVFWEVQLEGEF